MSHEEYMRLAIKEAIKGMGYTNPNPMVGAIIVKDGRIIGKGYHEKYGQLHAERNAIASCTESPEGAAIYVTLEPCCHYGKTPPCTEAIIENKISTVIIGSSDPNPLVAGNGIKQLQEHGIQVIPDVLKAECDAINEVFFHYIRTKTPYVVMKYAMTADGKIAAYTGESKWITGEKAREHVQHSRHRYAGIMVGIGTVMADDPMLDCRLPDGCNPLRIICDTALRTPLTSKIVSTAKEIPTCIATSCKEEERLTAYQEKGCEILQIPKQNGHVDLTALMKKLGEKGIDSILLEGGSGLNYSALQAGIVNKVQAYIAPKLFGGETAKTPVGGQGVAFPKDAFFLEKEHITLLEPDILIEWEVKKDVHRDC
ncbi:MAG: bifunctional diaminohydroxyphosphoribosylaminopyrimidine deaminase/5-amino-6-(5-phosphoribosylamino)uracil reductase RibD [Lachnospiraceae bacterium]|nr:bifunctional diaminohydroxyphosphoribosylaminopyrimidine deaminase/5-amino-6-(5-phosphoribosylamino)uracil reductase RibD [Lachnospiraceae bacterium]